MVHAMRERAERRNKCAVCGTRYPVSSLTVVGTENYLCLPCVAMVRRAMTQGDLRSPEISNILSTGAGDSARNEIDACPTPEVQAATVSHVDFLTPELESALAELKRSAIEAGMSLGYARTASHVETELFELESSREKALAALADPDSGLEEKLHTYGESMRELGYREGHNAHASATAMWCRARFQGGGPNRG